MTENVDNRLLEHMRAIRGGMDKMAEDIGDIKLRLESIETYVAQLHKDSAHVQVRVDRMDDRMARIEKRLELVNN